MKLQINVSEEKFTAVLSCAVNAVTVLLFLALFPKEMKWRWLSSCKNLLAHFSIITWGGKVEESGSYSCPY